MIRPPRGPVLIAVKEETPAPAPSAKPQVDDRALVAAIRAGDESAATTLHHRLRGRIDGTIRRILGGRDVDHDDLVQLSLVEVITSIDRYRGDAPLEAWAAGITAHVVYNHLRRRKLERRIFSSAEVPPDTKSQSMFRMLVARDSMRKIRELLDEMEENKAWTFVLHDVCGFDLREIASITGVTVAAAQRRLVRGRDELHDRIKADALLANVLQEMESEV